MLYLVYALKQPYDGWKFATKFTTKFKRKINALQNTPLILNRFHVNVFTSTKQFTYPIKSNISLQQMKIYKLYTKSNLSLYSLYHAEACKELAVPISASYLRHSNTATCVDIKVVAIRLQRSVRFGRSGI